MRQLGGRIFVLAMASFAVVMAQTPEVVLHPSSPVSRWAVLTVRPHSTTWVSLEVSSDLARWQPLANVLTTNSSGPFIDYSTTNSLVRFYRARSPGVSVAQALSSWQAVRPPHYQYSFVNSKLDTGGVVWLGTVSISNGVKRVTNVTVNDRPTTDFDPADFLTPEEMFAKVADVEARRVKLAHVIYDEQWSFPATVLVLHGGSIPITDYRVSGFQRVESRVSHIKTGRGR